MTALAVRNVTKPGLYGDGLWLQVSTFGAKAWVFRFTLQGRARKAGLGPVHKISSAEARKRAADLRLNLHDGFDPIDERRAKRGQQKVEAAKAIIFKECAEAHIDRRSPPTSSYRSELFEVPNGPE